MMKKILFSLFACLVFTLQAHAVPAMPGRFAYTQPDGTVRYLERHGDEFFHWTTDAQTGQVVELDLAGYWRPARRDNYRRQQAQAFRRQVNQYRRESRAAVPAFNQGVRHIPVILVEFTDVRFSVSDPATQFNNLLNQPGYSDYQATGSVLDYFQDNSHGLFTPVFDVFGPVRLPHEMAYYGRGEGVGDKATEAVIDGAELLDDQIDFSQYDSDGDGAVDMLLMYYAGYSQAEGGPEDAIWPHQWYVNGYRNVILDGKLLYRYFCTAELRGNKGSNMCSIGATCHEFSHALGLPDFYDTDYEENGQCSALYTFSLMCSGCYNNNARTPPFLNAEERVMLGWMDPEDVREFPDGEVRFPSVSENIAYKSTTDTEGEYFLYECRDGYSWDTPLPAGLVAYHVDKSPLHTVGGIPCDVLWSYWSSYNSLNAYADHPCFYVVPAAEQNNLQYTEPAENWVFPGTSRVTEFRPYDWDGNDTGVRLLNIRYDESEAKVSVTVENHFPRELRGTVYSLDGQPIQGVYIRLAAPGTDRRIRRKGSRSAAQFVETTSGPDGTFVLNVKAFGDNAHLSALKAGYLAFENDIVLKSRITELDVRMRNNSETGQSEIHLYDDNAMLYCLGLGLDGGEMAGSLFSASTLSTEVGRRLASFQYSVYSDSAEELYFIVDDASSGERLVTYQVKDFQHVPLNFDDEAQWAFRADVSEAGFTIPAGRDLIIGYAIKEPSYHYPFMAFEGEENYYAAEFNLEKSQWTKLEGAPFSLLIAITLEDAGGTEPVTDMDSLGKMGYYVIDPGTGVYKAGESFQLQLMEAAGNPPASVTWFWDGMETGAKSVTLTSGEHCVECHLTFADGSREVLELPLQVN